MLDKLDQFDFSLLKNNQRGIERESLRVDQKGVAAQTPHPDLLGQKLTNDFVTVDFSEGLLELITPPFSKSDDCYNYLRAATAYTQQALNIHELMWAGSMPPCVQENEIQIADFGTNVSAKMKEIYRKGLALRYGKRMQVIAGIHYNFSISEEFLNQLEIESFKGAEKDRKSYLYFRLIKRYYQISWLLPYLFGCSPVCAKASVSSKPSYLKELDDDHYYGEYATSLRMSDLGYQSKAQENLFISCENVEEYVRDLIKATDTPYPDYVRMGLRSDGGQLQQLNRCILQIENEYYNTIRPKQIAKRCERPACALLNRGVEYVEARLLDVDLFSDIGICEETGQFMEVFLMLCMLAPELDYTERLVVESQDNFAKVVKYGRKPGLELVRCKQKSSFKAWANELLIDCMNLAKHMDQSGDKTFQSAVQSQINKLNDPLLTPSARVLNEVRKQGGDYHQWLLQQSKKHAESLKSFRMSDELKIHFDQKVKASIEEWNALEAKDLGSIEDYISAYYQSSCGDS